jgi:hypothetical protein
MEELIDLIATNSPPSEISDNIKKILFAKSVERIESIRPEVANSMFNRSEGTEE